MKIARTYLLALLTACLLTTGCGKKDTFEYQDREEQAIGQLLGEQVAAEAPGGGKVVVLLRQGSGDLQDQKNTAYLAGLAEGFGEGSFQIQQAGPDLTTVNPQHQAMVVKAMTKGWPARAFLGWCAVDRKAAAVVSFIEFPSAGVRASTFKKLPPVFVYSTTGAKGLRKLASGGVIRTAILPKADIDNDAVPPKKASAREIVDLRSDVVSR